MFLTLERASSWPHGEDFLEHHPGWTPLSRPLTATQVPLHQQNRSQGRGFKQRVALALTSTRTCSAGVVETGLFIDMAEVVYFGMEDGSVSVREKQPR